MGESLFLYLRKNFFSLRICRCVINDDGSDTQTCQLSDCVGDIYAIIVANHEKRDPINMRQGLTHAICCRRKHEIACSSAFRPFC